MKKFLAIILSLLLLVGIQSCNDDIISPISDLVYEVPTNTYVSSGDVLALLGKAMPATRSENTLFQSVATIDAIKAINSDEAAYYVVNYKGGGWVIMAADNRIDPILAFSEEGYFPTGEEIEYPEGIATWMDGAKMAIDEVRASNEPQTAAVGILWDSKMISAHLTGEGVIQKTMTVNDMGITTIVQTIASSEGSIPLAHTCDRKTTSVLPLTSEQAYGWGQGDPYNRSAKLINGTRAKTGCVPLAMAQIVFYHKYPTKYNYTISASETSNGIYKMIADCGYSLPSIKWGISATSAQTSDVAAALKGSSFGYKTATWKSSHDESLIIKDLDKGLPVILRAHRAKNGSTSGHAWICDGHKTTTNKACKACGGISASSTSLFYMKWGWSGNSNGWYSLNLLNPPGKDTPYTSSKGMVYNIQPNK